MLKERIIDEIIIRLIPLRTLYKEEIDTIANKYLKDWPINRLDKAGAAILRMAIYELKYMDTPSIVVINEAIELAKKYTDEDLVKMINAVLDKFMKAEL